MNNQLRDSPQLDRHLKLWIYLLPVVGIIPSAWTLYRSSDNPSQGDRVNLSHNREQKKASRLSLSLGLIWLVSYSSLFFGAAYSSEIMSFRLLYANTLFTTTYFLICTVLMFRLSHKR